MRSTGSEATALFWRSERDLACSVHRQQPRRKHPDKGEDGPAAAAEGFVPGADLAISKAEHPRHEECEEEERQRTGSAMNMKLPAYQRGLKGKNGRTP